MTLRLRLFLLIGTLLAVLAAGGWWGVQALTRDLSRELGEVAYSVGRSMVAVFTSSETAIEKAFVGPAEAGPGAESRSSVGSGFVWTSGGEQECVRRVELQPAEGGEGEVIVEDVVDCAPTLEGADVAGDRSKAVHRVIAHRTSVPGGGEDDRQELEVELLPGTDDLLLRLGTRAPPLAIPVPRRGVDAAIESFSRRLLVGSSLLLGVGLLGAALVAHRVSAPLRSLVAAARRVGGGELGVEVGARGSGEVAEAIAAFDGMSRRLERLDADARAMRAQQHLGELAEVARGIAHSLRNPLNALGLSVEELAVGPASAEAEELAVNARRQIRRIDEAIRSFLALASGSEGAVAEVDLLSLVQDVALEVLQAGPRGVAVEVIEPPVGEASPPAVVPGLAPELRAVIQAVVVNAVEASPDNGRVRVEVTRSEDGRSRVTVEDDGPGVPPEVMERLFTPHVTTKAHGSGMGLFIAQRIATTRYGGGVHLESRGGGGTRAVVEVGPRGESEVG